MTLARRITVPLAAGLVLAGAAGPGARAAGPDAHAADQWLESMRSYFEAHPSLKSGGTGWKPYERIRWYADRLRTGGALPEPGAVQSAVDERVRRQNEAARAAVWFEVGPFERSGRILDLAFGSTFGKVWAASASGGLWRSTDSGNTWTALTDGLASPAIGAVGVDPNDENVVVIATGEGNPNAYVIDGMGILRSTDGGSSWMGTNVFFPRGSGTGFHFVRFAPSLPGVVLAGGYNRLLGTTLLYRSTDGGATWAQDGTIADEPFECRFGYDPGRLYLAVGDLNLGGAEIVTSTDAGVTWSNTSTGLPLNAGRTALDVYRNDDGDDILYAHCSDNFAGGFGTVGIYRSTDGGATFQARNTTTDIAQGQGWYDLTVSVDPFDPDVVLAGGVRLWRSTDGGVTFAETGSGIPLGDGTNLHVDNQTLEWDDFGWLWSGTDGGIWISTDEGVFWGSTGWLGTYQFYDICVGPYAPEVAAGGTQDNGTPTRPFLGFWEPSQPEFGDGMVCNIDPSGSGKWYGESQYGAHLRSTDHGYSWTPIVNGITGTGRWLTPVAMDPTNPAVLFTETTGGIFRTSDSGTNWSRVALHRAVWIDVGNPSHIVWTVNDDGSSPRVSHGGGASGTWSPTAAYGFALGGPATRVVADPNDSSTVYVTFGGYGAGAHVAMSEDDGATWTDVTGNLPNAPIYSMAVDPIVDEWFVGGVDAVWRTIDNGATWMPLGMLPAVPVFDLEIRESNPRKLVAGTYGRGIWELGLSSGGGVGVDDPEPTRGVRHLMLDPPAPNPVRDGTTIRFAARFPGDVSLQVFDVAGRRVSDLATVRGDGRVRLVSWTPADVPPGTYFVVLRAGEERVSRKVIVVR